MKKIAIILSAVLAMTAFSGCKKSEKSGDKIDMTKPEGVVLKLYEDLFEGNLGDYDEYALEADEEDEEAWETLQELSIKGMFTEAMTEEFGLPEEVSADLVDVIIDSIEYEVVEVEEDGDTAEVTVAVLSPDFENMEFDEEDMMKEAMGVDPSTMTEEEALEWLEELGINQYSTEEEMTEAVFDKYADEIVDYFADAIKNADKVKTEEGTVTVVKNDDGEWRITDGEAIEKLDPAGGIKNKLSL